MNTTIKKTMADTIQEEAAALIARTGGAGFVYINKPYSCGISEALSHFRPFEYLEFPKIGAGGPVRSTDTMETATSKDGRATIERATNGTEIVLKPLKGSRMRRPYVIRLWV